MNLDYYQQFVSLQESGRKAEAKVAVDLFIASFKTPAEIQQWVFSFLKAENDGHKIRHEIYEKLIYPVLLDGYLKKDASSTAWLAKTTQNLCRIKSIHPTLKDKGEIHLFEESYKLEPNEEIRLKLLESWLNYFSYSQHEWPNGILRGMNGADIKQCEEIARDIEFVRTLDTQNEHEDYLSDYEAKVREYSARLQNR